MSQHPVWHNKLLSPAQSSVAILAKSLLPIIFNKTGIRDRVNVDGLIYGMVYHIIHGSYSHL